jgi:glutathione S-transferase
MLKAAKHQLDVLGSVATSTLALWRGTSVNQAARQPRLPLKLYDMEGSPHCRVVREALTALGLDAAIHPCPRGGQRFRPEVLRLGGKLQFPFFVDANTRTRIYESADIVDYLFRTYGDGTTPAGYLAGGLTPALEGLGSLVRGLRGTQARASHAPKRPLALWSFESSPYSRLVRERLTELELPYTLHNLGKEQFADMGPAALRIKPGPYRPKKGGKREQVLKRLGRVQLPYLEDPNTGAKLFESAAIIDYLERQYAA